ncbi:GNAT family N-acetyltransferase [Ravibacter arvi]|uniref:GNAT family N-acetyltransferase n=1 Tax=Ravibacter arvi TaxID=2051041 RepID=A0ABP8LV95_9BACT
MSGFTTRAARPADIPLVIDLQKQTWWVTYEPIIGKDQCDDMFARIYNESALLRQMDEHRFFILEADSTACGFASYAGPDPNGIFKLHKIYVTPATQGTGAGRFLLSAIEDQVKQRKGNEIRLNVNRHNPARTFYEKMGYRILFEEDIPIGDFWMNDYVMGKLLTV